MKKLLFVLLLAISPLTFADTLTCYMDGGVVKEQGRFGVSAKDATNGGDAEVLHLTRQDGVVITVGTANCIAQRSK